MNDHLLTGSVRLVDRRTRTVELLGMELPGSRRPTDIQLLFDEYSLNSRPTSVGICIKAGGRRAKFYIDDKPLGTKFLDLLGKAPDRPVRLARPWGLNGWLVRE